MRTIRPNTALRPSLLLALLVSASALAANLNTKPLAVQPTRANADAQNTAQRQGSFNVNGINWNCSGTQCSASLSPVTSAAPATLCQGLAREVGALRSFSVANHALSAQELQQCNNVVAKAIPALPHLKTPPGFKPQPPPAPDDAQAKNDSGKKKGGGGFAMPPATSNAPAVAPPPNAKPGKGFLPDTAPVAKTVTVAPPARTITTNPLVMTGNRFQPRTINTTGLVMTGTRFPGANLRTGELVMTGIRFRPKEILTAGLTMTGTRVDERLVLTRASKERTFSPVIIGTDTLRMTGQRFHPVTISTSSLSFTGTR